MVQETQNMLWGSFSCAGEIHVAPCDDEGLIFNPHILDVFCCCHPEVNEQGHDGTMLVVHNQVN